MSKPNDPNDSSRTSTHIALAIGFHLPEFPGTPPHKIPEFSRFQICSEVCRRFRRLITRPEQCRMYFLLAEIGRSPCPCRVRHACRTRYFRDRRPTTLVKPDPHSRSFEIVRSFRMPKRVSISNPRLTISQCVPSEKIEKSDLLLHQSLSRNVDRMPKHKRPLSNLISLVPPRPPISSPQFCQHSPNQIPNHH
jgi:hypothetical protein